MRIFKAVQKIPGGLMIVPLLLGVLTNTFFPEILMVGGFAQALFKEGAMALIGAFLLCMGAQLPVRAAGAVATKGFAILIGKLLAAITVGLIAGMLMPSGTIMGLTPLAIVAAMSNSNTGLYAALTQEFGNVTDRGAAAVITINDGPFLTLVVLGAAGMASFPLVSFLAVLAPVLIGFILGNLDHELRDFLRGGERVLIPFFAFPLGAGINLGNIVESGLSGILLGFFTLFLSGGCAVGLLWIFQVLSKRPKHQRNLISAVAESSTAGAAVATPAVAAAADPALAPIVDAATVQVAGSVIVTALLTPVVTALWYKWQMKRGVDPMHEYDDPALNGSPEELAEHAEKMKALKSNH
ncbi:2-keto-3-deoxygluconate permease [Trueperella abortisuis]|uniref:2-keto-3-deoxygluconate permease n=1 Tax=Trueperella abortisuis TaxID=445930 RepID=A0ABT9PGJ9_9ACTO|nr:2-keto-3-deoxygluconate permease [Trueperella abortisuis]MDP9831602.1 2-keto-3-deoxygluconate permease [Trueperella abortisuis]